MMLAIACLQSVRSLRQKNSSVYGVDAPHDGIAMCHPASAGFKIQAERSDKGSLKRAGCKPVVPIY